MDLQECMWQNVFFFAASSTHRVTEIVVFVREHGNLIHDIAPMPNTLQDNFSTLGIIVVLVVLFSIEHVLSYVQNKPVKVAEVSLIDESEEESIVEPAPVCNEQIVHLSSNVGQGFLNLLEDLRVGQHLYTPQKAEEGTSGVYFLKNASGMKQAVFKPADEEGIHLEDYKGGEIKPGCNPGEGHLKEAAAYLLDKDGFHGVPATILSSCDVLVDGIATRKAGSLQEFVLSECTAEDMGSSRFSARDVHKIGLLDCRILNLDRHLGNILVTEGDDGSFHLVPIDHALSLPAFPSEGASFEWLQFPQCKQPFDQETVNFVCNIDVESDVQMLRRQLPNLREECVETMKICTIFLKKAVASGFNLYEIGCMMSRYRNEEESSALENLCLKVREQGVDSASFWSLVNDEVDRILTRK